MKIAARLGVLSAIGYVVVASAAPVERPAPRRSSSYRHPSVRIAPGHSTCTVADDPGTERNTPAPERQPGMLL
jgi:hypothetical protein